MIQHTDKAEIHDSNMTPSIPFYQKFFFKNEFLIPLTPLVKTFYQLRIAQRIKPNSWAASTSHFKIWPSLALTQLPHSTPPTLGKGTGWKDWRQGDQSGGSCNHVNKLYSTDSLACTLESPRDLTIFLMFGSNCGVSDLIGLGCKVSIKLPPVGSYMQQSWRTFPWELEQN